MATATNVLSAPQRTRKKMRRVAAWCFVILIFALPLLVMLVNARLRENGEMRRRQQLFCERVKQQGGAVGLYSADNWLTNLSQWLRAKVGWGLPAVRANRYVGSLRLMGPEFGDDLMPLVASFERLEELHFYATAITDEGLANLSGLKELTVLILDPQISDAGLEHLGALAHLTTLDLVGAQIEGEGLHHLRRLSWLRNLYLTSTPLTDRGLKEIFSLQSLEKLNLSYTQVTDAGLVHLARLKNLQQLDLAGTEVSDQAVQTLQGALPKVKIHR